MLESLRLAPFLLVPVAALLFLNLRLSRKLRYPHDLLKAEERRGMASFLFRSFRTHYDVLLDGAIALVLAFALAPPETARPSAVVIDGSRSMLAGLPGDRPLERALKRMRTDPGLARAEPFLLAFDPDSGETRLAPIASLLEGTDPESSVRRLRDAYPFFASDYGRLVELRKRGYGEITLLTDQLRVKPEGFQGIELGMAVNFAAYPSGVRFDRASGAWLITLAESGPHVPMLVSIWDRSEERFVRLALDRYWIDEGLAGRIVRFPAPGLYLLSLKGPFGLDDIDMPVFLEPRPIPAAAVGTFSERMLAVFPDIDRAASPVFVFSDRGMKVPTGTRTVTTAISPQDTDQVLDPAAAGGALIAIGSGSGSDLVLGPSSLKNEDLVLAYASILTRKSPPFLTSAPPGTKRLFPVGTSYLTTPGLPLIAPPSVFFETRPLQRLLLPPPASRRWPWALLLAFFAAVKLVAWSGLSGKSMFGRD